MFSFALTDSHCLSKRLWGNKQRFIVFEKKLANIALHLGQTCASLLAFVFCGGDLRWNLRLELTREKREGNRITKRSRKSEHEEWKISARMKKSRTAKGKDLDRD